MPQQKQPVSQEDKQKLKNRLIAMFAHLKEEDNATAMRMYEKIMKS